MRKTITPFFSIIIPVYNVAPYLRECLDSVLAQTYPNWECLCVDDGSTDESGAILDEYAQKDPRFRVFHKKNGGVSAARNLALDNVKGEYVCFLDGDDLLNWNYLNRLVGVIQASNCDVVRFSFTSVKDKSEAETLAFSRLDITTLARTFLLPNCGKEGLEIFATDYICRLCIKSEIIQENRIRFEFFSHCEDALFNFTCFHYLKVGCVIDDVLYFYRKRDDSAVRKLSFKHLESSICVTKRKFEIASAWSNFSRWYSVVYKQLWRELAGHRYSVVKLAKIGDVERKVWWDYYCSALEYLYHQKGFHPNLLIQKWYCFVGFFSWKLVAIFCLRMPLLVKGKIFRMLHR